MTDDTIITKIQKLLALANSPNEHEAQAAARKAVELMEKHRISDAEVEARTGTRNSEPITTDHAPLYKAGKEIRWKTVLGSAVAKSHGCQTWLRTWKGGGGFEQRIIGRASDVEAIRTLFDWLCLTAERLRARQHSPSYYVTEKKWRSDYIYGFASGVSVQIAAARAQAQAEAQARAARPHVRGEDGQVRDESQKTTTAAIVLINKHDEDVKAALDAMFPEKLKPKTYADVGRTSGYHRGVTDGQRIHLGKSLA